MYEEKRGLRIYVDNNNNRVFTEMNLFDAIDTEVAEEVKENWEYYATGSAENFEDLSDDEREEIYDEIMQDYIEDNFSAYDIDLTTGEADWIF